MGLSIYKSDIDTISDNINIINYKQKNIENVINTINNSVNSLKTNCYGTTVSVMCFKLNNLKQQIESINEYLTKYKQESQQVVDLYYQHCDGLNLDEDTLRNNISILNNKIDIYNNLSKPNKRLVNNAILQLDRNQELLDGLYYVSDTTSGMMQVSAATQEINKKDGWDTFQDILNHPFIRIPILIGEGNLQLFGMLVFHENNPKAALNNFGKWKATNFAGKSVKSLGWVGVGITIIDNLKQDMSKYDYSQPESWIKTGLHIGTDLLIGIGCVELGGLAGGVIGGAIGSVIPVVGTAAGEIVGTVAGEFLGGAAAWAISTFGKPGVDCVKQQIDTVVDECGNAVREVGDWLGKQIGGIGKALWW